VTANGGGALVNMLSIVSWFTNSMNGSYGASKAAAWAIEVPRAFRTVHPIGWTSGKVK